MIVSSISVEGTAWCLNRNERTTLYLKLVKRAKKKRMQFGDLNVAAGLQALDGHLADKSYIGGYLPTQADVTVRFRLFLSYSMLDTPLMAGQ